MIFRNARHTWKKRVTLVTCHRQFFGFSAKFRDFQAILGHFGQFQAILGHFLSIFFAQIAVSATELVFCMYDQGQEQHTLQRVLQFRSQAIAAFLMLANLPLLQSSAAFSYFSSFPLFSPLSHSFSGLSFGNFSSYPFLEYVTVLVLKMFILPNIEYLLYRTQNVYFTGFCLKL